jgi:hypothetical protein
MLYPITTTAIEVVAPESNDRMMKFSAGKFAGSATSVYIRKVNTLSPWLVLNAAGESTSSLLVPHGTQLEAYTDIGTADLVVLKTCCT